MLSFLLFLMSYSIILEPHYEPKESGAYICEETCSIYEQNDGTYKLFMDGQYIGVLDNLKFLNDETFKDLTIEFHSYNDK